MSGGKERTRTQTRKVQYSRLVASGPLDRKTDRRKRDRDGEKTEKEREIQTDGQTCSDREWGEGKNSNSNSKSSVLKASSVRSIWTERQIDERETEMGKGSRDGGRRRW